MQTSFKTPLTVKYGPKYSLYLLLLMLQFRENEVQLGVSHNCKLSK